MLTRLGAAVAKWVRRGDPDAQLAALERSLAAGWSAQAFEALRQLGHSGWPAAQHRLGQMYEQAVGVVQSISDAVYWYRLAAVQGHVGAQVRLGLIYFIDPPAPASLTGRDGMQTGTAPVRLEGSLSKFFPNGVSIGQDFVEALKWNRLAAEGGSSEAQARLGHQLALGLGAPRDVTEAEMWFARAAEQGDPAGQAGLGLLYAGTYETPPDPARAKHWLELAAETGSPVAQYALGTLYWQGAEKDPAAAVRYLERAAAQQYLPALYFLGIALWRGDGPICNLEAAESWLRRAAARGHLEAGCALARMLLERPDDDGVEAAGLLRAAAETGHRGAAAILAELYVFGRGVPRDAAEASRWLDVADTESRPEAFTLLASMHAEGIGVSQDFAAAADWLRQAASRGHVDAFYNLGSLYRLGQGVPRDSREAARWYQEAAERGNSEAAFQLGILHAEHDGDEPPDFGAARAWIERAAAAGHAAALAWMGDCCRLGLVGPPDFAEAEIWYRRAAVQGHAGAIALLAAAIENSGDLTPDAQAELFGLWLAAASAGDIHAQYAVGQCYREGRGCAADAAAARDWFERAAVQGHDAAQAELAAWDLAALDEGSSVSADAT
jgi:TPR repeat protein